MQNITAHTIESLKGAGHFFTAGALAYQLKHSDNYGCHYGMKSDRDEAIRQFKAGYTAAQRSY